MSILEFFSRRKHENLRHKSIVFFICLLISSFVWVLIKLSNQYTSEIVIPLKYSDMPDGKILVNKVDSTIRIGITDRGFSLAWIKYFSPKKPLNIDIGDYRSRQHMHQYKTLIGTGVWSQTFLDQYDLKGKIDYIVPDTIAFYFEDRYSKTISVSPDIEIKYKKQFYAYDTMKLNPSKVTISGLYSNINAIDNISTVPVRFTNLSTSIDQAIPLKKPANIPEIIIEPENVQVKLPVEKFTESQIVIPVSKIREPEDMRIKIFPDKITIIYMVALKDFKKVNAEMFSCNVDLSNIGMENSNSLDISLSNHPQFIRILSIEPAEVEYLVLK